MNFGEALALIKAGFYVARKGWNGKGMYLFIIGTEDSRWSFVTNGRNDNLPCHPFIAMKTADDKIVPWLASQTDVLAEDWVGIN